MQAAQPLIMIWNNRRVPALGPFNGDELLKGAALTARQFAERWRPG